MRNPAQPDVSKVPGTMIPNPNLSTTSLCHARGCSSSTAALRKPAATLITAFVGPWGIKTDQQGATLDANFGRLSASPKYGTREIWELCNGGGGWDHPIHIHFEEGQILARNGKLSNVTPAELGRKDVYRLRPSGSVTLTMQFRDWGGMYMEHCHNTVHEDNAMLLRWETNGAGTPFLSPMPTPIPTPQGVSFIPVDEILPTAF